MALLLKISYRNLQEFQEENDSEESNSKDKILMKSEDEPIILVLQRGSSNSHCTESAPMVDIPEGMMDGMKSGRPRARSTLHLPTVEEEESVESKDNHVIIALINNEDKTNQELDQD